MNQGAVFLAGRSACWHALGVGAELAAFDFGGHLLK